METSRLDSKTSQMFAPDGRLSGACCYFDLGTLACFTILVTLEKEDRYGLDKMFLAC